MIRFVQFREEDGRIHEDQRLPVVGSPEPDHGHVVIEPGKYFPARSIMSETKSLSIVVKG